MNMIKYQQSHGLEDVFIHRRESEGISHSSTPLCLAVLFYCYLNLHVLLLLEQNKMRKSMNERITKVRLWYQEQLYASTV